MKLHKKTKIVFNQWVRNNPNLNIIRKIYIRLFFQWETFYFQYSVLTHFLDNHGIHMYVSPGKFLNDNHGRCYFKAITGIKQDLRAWETRIEAERIVLEEGLNLFWSDKGGELRNKYLAELN